MLFGLYVAEPAEASLGLADRRRQVCANELVTADGRAVEDEPPLRTSAVWELRCRPRHVCGQAGGACRLFGHAEREGNSFGVVELAAQPEGVKVPVEAVGLYDVLRYHAVKAGVVGECVDLNAGVRVRHLVQDGLSDE